MKYEVFFVRTGYAEVEANSPEEAKAIGDKMLEGEISWTDDWTIDAVQEADSTRLVYDEDRGFAG